MLVFNNNMPECFGDTVVGNTPISTRVPGFPLSHNTEKLRKWCFSDSTNLLIENMMRSYINKGKPEELRHLLNALPPPHVPKVGECSAESFGAWPGALTQALIQSMGGSNDEIGDGEARKAASAKADRMLAAATCASIISTFLGGRTADHDDEGSEVTSFDVNAKSLA